MCNKGFQTSSDLKRHKRTRVHQEKVEQVAAVGGDIDDDEAIITGTGLVVSGGSSGVVAGGSGDHDDGHETPEFKVWPEGHDEESRNSAASSQQPHVESAADLLSNVQQQQPSTTTAMETGYSSTIDMKDLGGSSAATTASWNASNNPVNTTASAGAATTTSSSSTLDMNMLKWQSNQSSSMPSVDGRVARDASGKRSSSVDSPGQDEERLTVVEGDDSSQDSGAAVGNPASSAAQ